MASDRSITFRIRAQVDGSAKRALDEVGRAAQDTSDKTVRANRSMAQSIRDNSADMQTAGAALTGFGLVTGAALAGSAKAAIDWESAFAGVKKTVDDNAAGYAALSDELRAMSRELPASASEIAGVAEAAGQLGVKRDDITSFTRTMIDLGETTNLSAEEAATSIAQMANVMGTSGDDVERLGSTLVALGNNSATTEADILNMAQRLSGAGAVVGLTEADVLALSAATASMGIEVEAGGTAVSKVFIDMSKAAQTGSAELDTFAKIAGMSASDFATAFKEDPAEAFAAFIGGLGDMQAAGGDVFTTLDSLGLSEVRVSRALLGMASSGDLLTDSLDLGASAWSENTALADEASLRYETVGSRIEIAKNNIVDAAISVGEAFLPAIATGAEVVSGLAASLSDLPDPVLQAGAGLGAIASGAALAGGATLLLAPRIVDTVDAFQRLSAASGPAAVGIKRFATFATGPWGLAIGAATIGIASWVAKNAEAEAQVDAHTDALRENGGVLGENNRQLAVASLESEGAYVAAEKLGINLDLVTDAALGNTAAQAELDAQIDSVYTKMSNADPFTTNATEQARLSDAVTTVVGAVKGESEVMAEATAESDRMTEAMNGNARSQEALTVESQRLTAQAEAHKAATEGVNEASAAQVEVSEEVLEAQKKWREEMAGVDASFISMSDAMAEQQTASQEWAQGQADAYNTAQTEHTEMTRKWADEQVASGEHSQEWADKQVEATEGSTKTWEDYYDGQSIGVEKWIAGLEEMVAAQADWEVNMLALSGRVSQATLDELARLGPEGAPLVADLVNASDAELARLDAVTAQRVEDATGTFAAGLQDAGPVIAAAAAQLGQTAADQIAAQIAAGDITAQEAVEKYNLVVDLDSDTAPAREKWGVLLGDVNGSAAKIAITANDSLARGALLGVVGDVDASSGTIAMLGNDDRAQRTRRELVNDVDASSGTASMLGDDDPAQRVRRGLVGDINVSDGTVDLLGNDNPAQGSRRGLLRDIDTSSGTVDLLGNDNPGDIVRRGFVRNINDSAGTVTLRGDDDPGQGVRRGFLGDINDSTGTLGIDAYTNPAQTAIDRFFTRNDNRTLSVNAKVGATSQRAMAIGGIIDTYANGGLTGSGQAVSREPMMGGPAYGKTNILWGEPETGWEAYISGKPGMEGRNRNVLIEAAERLGMTAFAGGGIYDQTMPTALNLSANVDQLGDLLRDAVAEISRSFAGGSYSDRGGDWQKIVAMIRGAGLSPRITSTYRPGARTKTGFQSRHALGKAVDMAPNLGIEQFLNSRRGQFRELYMPTLDRYYLKGQDRRRFPDAATTINNHNFAGGNPHIHAAYADGGVLPIESERGEHVLTAREVAGAGGHDSVYRMRKAMLSGDVRYDVGGEVGAPYAQRFAAQQQFASVSSRPQTLSLSGVDLTLVVDGRPMAAYVREGATAVLSETARSAVGHGARRGGY